MVALIKPGCYSQIQAILALDQMCCYASSYVTSVDFGQHCLYVRRHLPRLDRHLKCGYSKTTASTSCCCFYHYLHRVLGVSAVKENLTPQENLLRYLREIC